MKASSINLNPSTFKHFIRISAMNLIKASAMSGSVDNSLPQTRHKGDRQRQYAHWKQRPTLPRALPRRSILALMPTHFFTPIHLFRALDVSRIFRRRTHPVKHNTSNPPTTHRSKISHILPPITPSPQIRTAASPQSSQKYSRAIALLPILLSHLLPILCAIPAFWFNLAGFYHGDNLITSHSPAQDLVLTNWLQLAAKAQEVVAVHALVSVSKDLWKSAYGARCEDDRKARGESDGQNDAKLEFQFHGGRGLKRVTTFPFNAMRFLLVQIAQMWWKLFAEWKEGGKGKSDKFLKMLGMLGLFLVCFVVAAIGPASAVLIVPKQSWFTVTDLDFYFHYYTGYNTNTLFNTIYPQILAPTPIHINICTGQDATVLEHCPAGGFNAIMAWSTGLTKTDFLNDDDRFKNPMFQGKYISQLEARTHAAGGTRSGASNVWQIPMRVADQVMYVEDEVSEWAMRMSGFYQGRYRRWRGSKRRAMVKAKVPYTQTVCLAQQKVKGRDIELAFPLLNDEGDIYTVEWGERETTRRAMMAISNSSATDPLGGILQEWIHWRGLVKDEDEIAESTGATFGGVGEVPVLTPLPFTDNRLRLQWLPADPKHHNKSLRASARAVIYLPTDPNSLSPLNTTTPGSGLESTRDAYACTIFSWYAPADIVFSIAVTPRPSYRHRPSDRAYTGTVDADDFRNALHEEEYLINGVSAPFQPEFIQLTQPWLEALTPPLQEISPGRILTLEYILNNALVGRTRPYGKQVASRENPAVEILLAVVVNDGISRTLFGKGERPPTEESGETSINNDRFDGVDPVLYDPTLSPEEIGKRYLTGPSPIVDPCSEIGQGSSERALSGRSLSGSDIVYMNGSVIPEDELREIVEGSIESNGSGERKCYTAKARLILQTYGYGHVMGKTIVVCLTVLGVQAALSIAHFLWLLGWGACIRIGKDAGGIDAV